MAALLSSCAGIHVSSQVEPSFTPFTLDTYSWDPGLDPTVSEQTDAEIREQVEIYLTSLGMRPVESAEAKVLVSYGTSIETRVRETEPYFAYYSAEQYEVGKLTIELRDASTGGVLWTGSGQGELRLAALPSGPDSARMVSTRETRDWRAEKKVSAIMQRLVRDL